MEHCFKTKIWGLCAQYYCGATGPRSSQRSEFGNICVWVHVCTYLCAHDIKMYFCIHIENHEFIPNLHFRLTAQGAFCFLPSHVCNFLLRQWDLWLHYPQWNSPQLEQFVPLGPAWNFLVKKKKVKLVRVRGTLTAKYLYRHFYVSLSPIWRVQLFIPYIDGLLKFCKFIVLSQPNSYYRELFF